MADEIVLCREIFTLFARLQYLYGCGWRINTIWMAVTRNGKTSNFLFGYLHALLLPTLIMLVLRTCGRRFSVPRARIFGIWIKGGETCLGCQQMSPCINNAFGGNLALRNEDLTVNNLNKELITPVQKPINKTEHSFWNNYQFYEYIGSSGLLVI